MSFDVEKGQTFSIVGPSGSGKTTLLGLCAGLDKPNSGTVELCGFDLNTLNEDECAQVRNREVGFIFQNFQLLPTLTALENVSVPLELQGAKDATLSASALLKKARAFSNKPSILFADEPTGNLDEETGEKVIQLLFELNKDAGTTLIIISHDLELANRTQQILRLKGGKIITNEPTTSF